MRKKVIALLMISAFMLSGCGDSEKVITKKETDSTVKAGAEANTDVNDGDSQNVSGNGYVFKANGVAIAINAEAAACIEALGEPVSYYEAPSCAFGDLDKVYTYSGFELDTYSMNGKDYVSAVILCDDSVSTEEGVCIGDSADKLKEVYGDATTEDSKGIVYNKDDMKLCFIIKDGSISSIQYLNTILD